MPEKLSIQLAREALVNQTIENLNKRNAKLFIASTGAGAGIQNLLWSVPGSSSYLVGAIFPYDKAQTDKFCGVISHQAVSKTVARRMAMSAYIQAAGCSTYNQESIGLGITASVAGKEVHKGNHRVNLCIITPNTILEAEVILPKRSGHEARVIDGDLIDSMALQMIIWSNWKWAMTPHGIPVTHDWAINHSKVSDHRYSRTTNQEELILSPEAVCNEVMWREMEDYPPIYINSSKKDYKPNYYNIFSGSFNPIHDGHFDMAKRAEEYNWCPTLYKITVNPIHKPELTPMDALRRIGWILAKDNNAAVILTRDDALFYDQAEKYKGCSFIVGSDTVTRLMDPKWGIDLVALHKRFKEMEIELLLFTRNNEKIDTSTIGCDVIEMGDSLPISSTQIREQNG